MKRGSHPHLGRAGAAATLLVLTLALAVSAATPPSAAAACEPGQPGFRPPQGCHGLGGNPRRAVPQLATDTSAGRTPRFHFGDDACREVARWAPVHRQERDGMWITFYWVWIDEDRGRPHPMYLVCGNVLTVNGFSRGPGANGISLRCPVIEQLGRTRADAVGWWVNDRRGFSHVGGGFGGNAGFGFWNYRLYNPHADAARVRLYGACRNPPFGHP